MEREGTTYTKRSWYFGWQLAIIHDEKAADSPNLAEWPPLTTEFVGLNGDWIILDPVQITAVAGISTLTAYRLLPKDDQAVKDDFRFTKE